jgi:hypothetical protein
MASIQSHVQVRTVLGKGCSVKRYNIAFLDPRSSADIMLPDPRSYDRQKLISCLDYNSWKYPSIVDELQCDAAGQPLLPCIGVQLHKSIAAAGSSTCDMEGRFITYPVEVCW